MTSGLQNIPMAEYQADPAPVASLSAGLVDLLIRESPLHAWHAHPKLNPEYQPEVDSRFDIGTAAHALLFEGMDNAVIVEADDWRTKAARETRDAIRAAGKLPLLARHHAAVEEMVMAANRAWAHNDDMAGYSLSEGKNEWSIVWKSQPSDVWCRCRPDHLSKDRKLIVDAKFTDLSANPATFERQIDRMGYDSRAAFYLRGNAATGGPEDARYVYLIQETKPPYAASFIALDPAYLDIGARKVERAIAIWRDCMASGKWPGYTNRIHYAAPSAWQLEEAEMI
jgi:hypothetical protein